MVGKKVANPKRVAGKAERIIALTDYVRAPEGANSEEKCIYTGARGFQSDRPMVQTREMVALAEEATRSRDPVNHYVLSWREGEHPTAVQIEEAVTTFLRELGLEEHQAIYGLHADTHNQHLHVVVNRVQPETLKCIEINKGFDIEAVHRAVARIEHTQGWQREKHGRYVVLSDGEVVLSAAERKQDKQPDQQRRDMENRTGEKSAVRVAAEDAGDIFRTAASWQELHSRLAAVNMQYQRTGSGAVIFVGDVAVKASSVDRAASLAKMEKRLGTFELSSEDQRAIFTHIPEPDVGDSRSPTPNRLRKLSECHLATARGKQRPSVLQIDARPGRRGAATVRRQSEGDVRGGKRVASRPLLPGLPGWNEYATQRTSHYAERDAVRIELRRRQDAEANAMRERHRAARNGLFTSREWTGKGVALNALRSVMAAEQAAEKAALGERRASELKQFRTRFPPFPGIEEWLRKHQSPAVAEAWRYRNELPQEILGDDAAEESSGSVASDIRAFRAQVNGTQVEYVRRPGLDDFQLGRQPAFIDHGRRIQVNDWQDDASTLAAMQLAAQKWGSFTIGGNAEYQARCVRLAAEHGLKIKNPELQEAIAKERSRIAYERLQSRLSERHRQFERYADSVRADRYRVTVTRTRADGSHQTSVLLGKLDGLTREEMAQRAWNIDRLTKQGQSVSYMPLSDEMHHIVIAEMRREQVAQFLRDGFKPTVLLDVGPNQYQVVLTAPKPGTPRDHEVGECVAAELNRRYGNPAGAFGGQLRPASGRSADTEPSLRLAAHHECDMTCALVRDIDRQFAGELARRAPREVLLPETFLPGELPGIETMEAYRVHHADLVLRQLGGNANLSRIDSMVAVRLRVTGHSPRNIEDALFFCAPASRVAMWPNDGEGFQDNWEAYARRMVAYVCSPAGGREVAHLARYRDRWLELEGRLETSASSPTSKTIVSERSNVASSVVRRDGPP